MFGLGGGVIKMGFIPYSDVTYGAPLHGYTDDQPFQLQINPKEINLDYGLDYNSDESGATGESARPPGSATYKSPNLEIETYVDATGVLSHIMTSPSVYQGGFLASLFGGMKGDITDYVTELKKVVYDYVKDTHGPPFVKIVWGNVPLPNTNNEGNTPNCFKGQLTGFKINYELFSKSGTPIRAKITMSFKSMIDPNARETGQSPDLTHFHDVRMGDNLPALSKRIYGSPDFYMQLAKVNGLSSIYQLKPGMQLIIPPIEKSSR